MTTVYDTYANGALAGAQGRVWFQSFGIHASADGTKTVVGAKFAVLVSAAGVLPATTLEPGSYRTWIELHGFTDGPFDFVVPASGNHRLLTLIAAGILLPPATPDQRIAAAVAAYLTANPPSGGGGGTATVDTLGLTGATGRAVMKAGTQADARTVLNAASTDEVNAKVAALVAAAPTTLDTLDELAAAIGDDPNFAATLTALVGAKYTKPGPGIPLTDLSATGTKNATTFLRGDNTWTAVEANVELAYAEIAVTLAIDTSGTFADAAGLAITVGPGARPMMVKVHLATVYGTGVATWGFRVIRTSDGKVMDEGVSNTSVDVGYPPSPQLEFRVPAGAASTTYKVQTNRWSGSATGQINAQAVSGSGHRAFISAVSV